MKFKLTLFCLFLSFFSPIIAQENPVAYKIFTAKGKNISYLDMMKELGSSDVVFFGELHNNPICHWLQLEMTRDLYGRKEDKLVIGAEMFETDNQILINEYFLGFISERNFETEARLWSNYQTDYKPILNFAKEFELRFVATNVPRRYASMVSKQGLDALIDLPDYSKIYLPQLPIEMDMDLACYQTMLEMADGDSKFPQAQMLKDATMAYSIHRNLRKGDLFFHINGAFHSDKREGILWYLRKLNPNLKMVVVSTVEQEKAEKLHPDNQQKGDYIIVTPARMTKTH